MSSFSSVCKTIHMSPSSREHACGSSGLLFSQIGLVTHNQGQMLGTEHGLVDMTDTDYTHLQHLIQIHMEPQGGPPGGPDARSPPASAMIKETTGSTAISPFTAAQAIDLSTSADEHCQLMPGERTPPSYGEVPTFVMARLIGEDSPNDPPLSSSSSSQKPSRSAARVCLEKRFNTMSADTLRQQDIQSAVLSNFLTMLQQSAEAQEAVKYPQMQKWMKTDRANHLEVSNPYVGGVFNPVTNTCGQVTGHIPQNMEPNKHQGLIFPKSFSFNFLPERIITKAHYTSSSNLTEEQHLVNKENDMVILAATRKHGHAHSSQPMKAAKAAQDSAGDTGSSSSRKRTQPAMSLSQRKERHNSKERERRKRIRLFCDELNVLVPFCTSDTDKVTTLQWTTAFLRYINKKYGDTFKEEFQKSFIDEKGLFLKSSPSVQDFNHPEIDKTMSIPLVVEQ